MKPRSEFSIFPPVKNAARCTTQFNAFDHLIKNQISEQKMKSAMSRGMERKDLLLRNYKVTVLNRALFTIAFPIFVWLVLETFFK
jgi:hypothetical protein